MASFDKTALAHDEYDDVSTLRRRRPASLEKRAAARLPIETEVELEGGAHRFRATTANLSPGGMFVVTRHVIPVGVAVLLAFTLPNGASLDALGVVQWRTEGGEALDGSVREPGLGIAFFCLERATKEMLERFCVVREPLYYSQDASAERAEHGEHTKRVEYTAEREHRGEHRGENRTHVCAESGEFERFGGS